MGGVRSLLTWRLNGAIILPMMDDEHRTSLRLSTETYATIDDLRKKMPGNVSRNTWIDMAIHEKIDRDTQARGKKRGARRDA